jgi:hypothetical protein
VFSDKKMYTDSTYDSRTNTYYVSSYSYADRYHWGLYDTRTNRKLYTITDDSLAIELKTAVISDDGQNVVIIDDYPIRLAFKKREMMTFYERGTRLKRIYLGDLIQNFCSLSYSTSHMDWCRGYFHFNDRKEITIETHEFYRYTFNANGDLLHKQSDEHIQPGDILANGKIKREGKNQYVVTVNFCIRGNIKANETLTLACKDRALKKLYGTRDGLFKSRIKAMENGFTRTFIIRNSKIQKADFPVPNYNSGNDCNFFNTMD